MLRRFSILQDFKPAAILRRANSSSELGRRRAFRIATRRSTDTPAADHWRAPRQAPRRHSCKLLSPPIAQTPAQKLRLDSERFAHRLERERPFSAFADQPLLSLAEQTLARPALRVRIILEASQRVFQDRHHQLLDRADRAVVTPAVIKLLRRQNVWHEEISESAIFPFHRTLSSPDRACATVRRVKRSMSGFRLSFVRLARKQRSCRI